MCHKNDHNFEELKSRSDTLFCRKCGEIIKTVAKKGKVIDILTNQEGLILPDGLPFLSWDEIKHLAMEAKMDKYVKGQEHHEQFSDSGRRVRLEDDTDC